MPAFPAGVTLKLRINDVVYDPYQVEPTVPADTPVRLAAIIENKSPNPIRTNGGFLYAVQQNGLAADITINEEAQADADVNDPTNPEVEGWEVIGNRTSWPPSGSTLNRTIAAGDTGDLEFVASIESTGLHYVTFLCRLGDGSIQQTVTARLRIA